MSIKINIRPETKATAERLAAVFILVFRGFRETLAAIKENKRTMWCLRYAAKWTLVILLIALYTVVIYRVAYQKARADYENKMEIELENAAEETAPVDPYEAQLDAEAEILAKVLYGVKDNDNDDLRTYCWCVFNRVDNAAFPSTIEDVIAQPNQWMRYDQTNPIIESLYQMAREQLNEWHSNSHRPVSNEYVFMKWSNNDICLRDNFYEGSGCHYWRYGQ